MFDRRTVLALAGTLPLVLATRRAAAAGVDLGPINAEIALHHAAPGYESFRDVAAALKDILAKLRDGDLTLADSQGAFRNAMDSWMSVQHLRVGPSQLEAREFRIEYWPDKRNRVDRQLAEALEQQRPDLLEPEGMAGASVALQGFPVLERLLFVDPVAPGSYGAQLAASVGANLAAIAAELSDAWQPGSRFMSDLLEPGSSDTAYADDAQVAGHFLTACATQLEFIALRKLTGPLGATTDDARPRLAESWRSMRSLRNVKINVAALVDFIDGSRPSFWSAITAAGAGDAADKMRGGVLDSGEAMNLMPDDLESAMADPEQRDDLVKVAGWLDDSRRLLVQEGAPALGLNLGFNSLDGD